jgi:class 3 adenylate cyclase/predicted ATPase
MTPLRQPTVDPPSTIDHRDLLLRTIETLERQRHVLGSDTIDVAVAPLRSKLAALDGQRIEATLPTRTSERKVVTVLFADIAGFTAMSERIGSEATVEIVNALFDRLVPVIERYGGSVDKFIGDEIMAVFGAPRAAEHHVEHALRAALDMFDAVAHFNGDRGMALGLHIGVNSGPVVAGEVGSLARRDYSVTGDTVNVAARLEGIATAGQVLVGPSTFRHAATQFEFEALPALALKGKSRPVTVYRLRGVRAAHARVPADGIELAFSGRTDELQRVLARAAPDAPNSRGTVGIMADPGVGKSRLLAELRARADPALRWIDANAYDHRSDVSYGVVHDLLDALVGVATNAARADVEAAYAEFLDALPAGDHADIRPYVLRLRGLPLDPEYEQSLAAITPAALRERMTNAAVAFVADATAGRSAVIRIEDLHWADASSVALLRALAGDARLAHVLFVFTTRPDPGLARDWIEQLRASDAASVVELHPLSDDVVRGLLDRTFAGEDASHVLREQIRAKAQGNPFYLMSFLRSLVDEGVAEIRDETLSIRGTIASLPVPESLHAAVGARIDRLPVTAKQVLRWASVLGSAFWPAHVEALARSESGSGDVDLPLSILCERQLVEPESDGRMRFVHAVVQDVTYDGMLERDRRRLHAGAAAFLAQHASETSEADIALLAWHHERADERAAASLRYEQASKLAAKAFASREEIGYLESALRLADRGDGDRIRALSERLGDVLQISGRFAEATERFEQLRATTPAHTLAAARVMRKLAKSWTSRQRFAEGNRAVDEARAMLASIDAAEQEEARWREHFAIELFAMWASYMQARLPELAALATRLAPEMESHATLAERGIYHRSVALLRLREQRYRPDDETVALAAQAADELDVGDPAEMCLAGFGRGFMQLWSHRIVEADATLQQVLRDTTRVGDAERNMLCLTYLAVTARMLHDVDRAEAFARAAMAAAERNGARHYVGVAHANLAWVAWRRHDEAATTAAIATARQTAVLPGYPFNWFYEMVELARALERSDLAAAATCVRAMASPEQQLLRGDVQRALEAAAANATRETMEALLGIATQAGYA